jgi:hypothetical protein
VLRNRAPEDARAFVERLRTMGGGAVHGDPGDDPFAPAPARPRVDGDALVLEPVGHALPFSSIVRVVRATLEQEGTTESVRFSTSALDATTRDEHARRRHRALYVLARSRGTAPARGSWRAASDSEAQLD